MQHVGIAEDDVRLVAELLARGRRRIAVVHAGAQRARELDASRGEPREALELVLGERLGGKEVERGGVGVLEQALERGEVEAERLARRRARHHHRVAAGAQRFDGAHLVRVEAGDAARLERRVERLAERRLQFAEARSARRDRLPVDESAAVLGSRGECLEPARQAGSGGRLGKEMGRRNLHAHLARRRSRGATARMGSIARPGHA